MLKPAASVGQVEVKPCSCMAAWGRNLGNLGPLEWNRIIQDIALNLGEPTLGYMVDELPRLAAGLRNRTHERKHFEIIA